MTRFVRMRELKSQGTHHTEEEFLRLSADQIVGFVEAPNTSVGNPAAPPEPSCFVMLGASKADRIRVKGTAAERTAEVEHALSQHPLAATPGDPPVTPPPF